MTEEEVRSDFDRLEKLAERRKKRQRLQLWNKEEIVDKYIKSRCLIYLDQNVWIDLREAASETARCVLNHALSLLRQKRVLFPLSYPSVSELMEIANDDLRIRQSRLMDTLSEGVILIQHDDITEHELDCAYHWYFTGKTISVPEKFYFSKLPNYLGNEYPIILETLPQLTHPSIIDSVRKHPTAFSLETMISQRDLTEYRARHARSKERYVSEFGHRVKESYAHWRNEKKLRWNVLLEEERIALFKRRVLQGIRHRACLEHGIQGGLDAVTNRSALAGYGSKKRFKQLFEVSLTSLDIYAHNIAYRVLNGNRTCRPQDFWDTEHATIGATRCNVFVTQDRGLAEMLKFIKGRHPAVDLDILTTMEELENFLTKMVQSNI